MAATAYVQQYALSTTDTLTWNNKVYYPVTEWEISTNALGTATNIKAAIRFMMREDSELGSNYIIAQYSAYTTDGNKRIGDSSYMERRIGGAVTSTHTSPSISIGDVIEGTMASAIRVNRTWNTSVVTGGHFIDVNYPYMIYNCSSSAIGDNVTIENVPAFYVGDSNNYNTTEPSITSTYTTPAAQVGDKTYNKVVINGETLIDLSKDTVAASYMLASASGVSGSISAHDKNGQVIYGGIPTLSNGNLTRSGSIITAPAGYYAADASMAVSPGAWNIQYATTPYDVTLSATNLPITLSGSSIVVNMPNPVTASITATVTTSGYIDTGYQTGSIKVSGSNSVLATSIDSKLAAGNIKTGVTVFGVPGNYTYDASSPATSGEILTGKIAYVNGSKITGTMANWTTNNPTISLANEQIIISQGFHTGGVVSIDATSVSYLTPENIRAGSTILGVTGALTPSEEVVVASATAKGFVSLDPSASSQTFTPSGSVNFFNQVTIEPIIITSTVTSGTSGYTLTINASAPVFSASVQTSS